MFSRAVIIDDNDTVSRLIFRPKDFLNGTGPLRLDQSFFFQSKDDYKESVNCHRLVENLPEDLHAQGRTKAERQSEQKRMEGKGSVTYEGFSSAAVAFVRSIDEEGHKFDVRHSPVRDNRAHCDIVLSFPGDKPQKAQKNLAVKKLSGGFREIVRPSRASA